MVMGIPSSVCKSSPLHGRFARCVLIDFSDVCLAQDVEGQGASLAGIPEKKRGAAVRLRMNMSGITPAPRGTWFGRHPGCERRSPGRLRTIRNSLKNGFFLEHDVTIGMNGRL